MLSSRIHDTEQDSLPSVLNICGPDPILLKQGGVQAREAVHQPSRAVHLINEPNLFTRRLRRSHKKPPAARQHGVGRAQN